MAQYIDKTAVVAKLEELKSVFVNERDDFEKGYHQSLNLFISFLDTLEVKELKLPNPRFLNLDNIVDKVFGTGNLESFEYKEAEQLVLLAKEELLKDLEVKEVDLRKEMDREWSKCEPIDEGMGLEIASIDHEQFDNIVKHFFELGLKTRKEEVK